MGRAAGEGGEGEGAEADAGDGPGADEPPELPGKHRPQEVRAHAPPRGPPAPSFGKRSSQRDLGVVASASVILSWGRRPTADTADPPPHGRVGCVHDGVVAVVEVGADDGRDACPSIGLQHGAGQGPSKERRDQRPEGRGGADRPRGYCTPTRRPRHENQRNLN